MDYKNWVEGTQAFAGGGQVKPDKVHKVMHEFKHGELHSGSKHGPKVTSRNQAVAIALSEAGMSKKKGYADGGPAGDGQTPIPPSDTVPAALTPGEFVVPAEIVGYLGTGFFERLIKQTMMEMQSGQQAPGPWDEMAQDGGGAMVPGGMPSMPPRRA